MSADEKPPKPAYPEGYTVPKVWEFVEQEGKFGGTNRPTAGARFEKELPVGEHPLQLYSLGTPNGQKVTILLEELGIPYDAWLINIMEEGPPQFGSGFTDVNPNSKIPALVDRDFDPPLNLFESCHIMKYVAEKHGKFIPEDPRAKVECFNWLFWQAASAPFMGGGFGHFYCYAPVTIQYAIDRYAMETKRQLDVLDKHLQGKEFMCGSEYTIADMAIFPWIRCLDVFYKASEFLELPSYKNVTAWVDRIAARPAVQTGVKINFPFSDDGIHEKH